MSSQSQNPPNIPPEPETPIWLYVLVGVALFCLFGLTLATCSLMPWKAQSHNLITSPFLQAECSTDWECEGGV